MPMQEFFLPENDGILRLEDTPLFVRSEDGLLDDEACFARLAAEAVDSRRAVDGSVAVPAGPCLGNLLSAVTGLVLRRRRVRVESAEEKIHDGWWRVRIDRAWVSPLSLFDAFRTTPTLAVHENAALCPPSKDGFFLAVSGDPPSPWLRASDARVSWSWVFREDDRALRVGYVAANVVLLYRHGFLVGMEDLPLLRGGVVFDAYGAAWDAADSFFPSTVDTKGCSCLATALLGKDRVIALSGSAIACAMACRAASWRTFLSARLPSSPVEVLEDPRLDDAILQCLNVRDVVDETVRDSDLDLLGITLLSRLVPRSDGAVLLPCKEYVMEAFAIREVVRMVVSKACLSRLFAVGALSEWTVASPHGVLHWLSGGGRALAVPCDADAADVGMAIATMLTCAPQRETEPSIWPPRIEFQFDLTVECEGAAASGVTPREALKPYALRLDEEGCRLILVEDATHLERHGGEVSSVDDVAVMSCDRTRCRRDAIGRMFPKLSTRLAGCPNALQACLREVQARRIATEWSIAGFDEGSNMSSLGMSVLLCLCLGGWHGARVRVYVGRRRSACVGYWHGDDFCLVDPVATTRNAFHVGLVATRPTTATLPETRITRTSHVQVLRKGRWHTARVTRVSAKDGVFEVSFVLSRKHACLTFSSPLWRPAARDESDDIESVLKTAFREVS